MGRAPPRAAPRPTCTALLAALLITFGACARTSGEGGIEAGDTVGGGAASSGGGALRAILLREVARIDSAAAAADSIFQPLPLLTPAAEASLRSFSNARQLERARQLGIDRDLEEAELEARVRDGRLVRLEDSDYWVVGDLEHSRALVVPGVRDLLTELGERFHARLEELGSPKFRFEISSVLRSAADQAALREVNPNAAVGESTHEYGTTVDVLYSAFAAPVEPLVSPHLPEAAWARPFLQRYATVAAERVAARRAMELEAILGGVLQDLQQDGQVMVTLERQQPVFHMTLADTP